jgi:hypothetical protein
MQIKRISRVAFMVSLSVYLGILWISSSIIYSLPFSQPSPWPAEKDQKTSTLSERGARYLQYADEVFDPNLKRIFQSEHYIVITDHPDTRAAKEIALTFESIRAVYCALFKGILPIHEEDSKTHILLFQFEWGFERFYRKAFNEDLRKMVGCYIYGTPIISSHYEHANERDLLSTLIHNGVYQLNDQILYSKNASQNLWVTVGLAGYFAQTKLGRKGELKIGKIDWKSNYVKCVLPRIQRMIKKKTFIKLEELISCDDRNVFYGENEMAYFGESWLFIHFLLHFEEGRYKKKFTEYMTHEIKGDGSLITFKEVFGDNIAVLEKRFLKYVKQL